MNPQQQASSPSPALDPRQQVAQQIKGITNVLVTVSANPSVDQLAAAIGTTLVLNKLGKHATAVFSGEVPSTIEFLRPEKTLEKTTDSLRDFIIALDKSKADKLRYKVEDKFVRIYITPYHTNLGEKDLEFSQGDYNVEVVLALGVKKRDDLDQAIVSHGRILHDAAVISVNTQAGADLGSINLNVPDASSLSEVMVGVLELIKDEQKPLLDEQIATAFLTGIVAETNRFSNAKTSPQTMNTAARLMNSGANQQLIATKLEQPKPIPPKPATPKPPQPPDKRPGPGPGPTLSPRPTPTTPKPPSDAHSPDGTIEIPHESKLEINLPDLDGSDEQSQENIDRIHIDNEGTLRRVAEEESAAQEDAMPESRKVVDTPPKMGSRLSANTEVPASEPSSDPLSSQDTKSSPILNRDDTKSPALSPLTSTGQEDQDDETLTEIEEDVNSPHSNQKSNNAKPSDFASLVNDDKDLPPDPTAGNSSDKPEPPPIPPPLPMSTPSNLSDPNSGVPL